MLRSVRQRTAEQADGLRRLTTVAENAAVALAVTDPQGRVAWCNRAFDRLCQLGRGGLVNRPLAALLTLLGADSAARDAMCNATAQGRGLQLALQRPVAKGGLQNLKLDLQPALDEAGLAVGFVATLTEATPQVTPPINPPINPQWCDQTLLAALPHGVVLRTADGRVSDCNPAAALLLRLSRAQLLGDEPLPDAWHTVHEDLRTMPLHERPALRVLAAGRAVQGAVMGVVSAEGQLSWLLVNAEPVLDAQGQTIGSVACFTDLTPQRDPQTVLAHTVAAAGLGTWQWDMQSGAMVFNDRLLAMLGYRPGDIGLTIEHWHALVHPDDIAGWRLALRRHLADPRVACRSDLRVRRSDGEWAAVLSCGVVIERDGSGAPRRMAGIHIDMTEQMQIQAQLRHAARTDGLTQLPNRASVFEQVQLAVNRAAAQPGFEYAVLFMDFDRFKQINDTFGHAAGDELLCQIAQRLRGALRQGDAVSRSASHRLQPAGLPTLAQTAAQTAGRIGGDEFVVLLEGVQGRDEACAVARRLMDVLAAPYRIGGQVVHSSASIGIVTSEHPANDANTVMHDADTAMYEAKRAGRGRYIVFDPAMHERVARKVKTESDLRLALQRDELFVVYQPVVELQQEGRCGVEAVVRWRHPSRGLVNPVDFIPVAEESGLIVELGAFVLQAACGQFVAWQRALGPLAPSSLAVNLSAVQLRMPGLIAEVQRCLAQSHLAPERLQLEVTESLAAQDDHVRAKLRELKAMGIRIALDDFGTGYSSLACLHQLPVDTVKIDRSFVMHAETSDYHRVLIEATIRVAQTLGMNTVAEGIETESQAALMRRLHCDRGQGYFWARPLEADALGRWLTLRGAAQAAAA